MESMTFNRAFQWSSGLFSLCISLYVILLNVKFQSFWIHAFESVAHLFLKESVFFIVYIL